MVRPKGVGHDLFLQLRQDRGKVLPLLRSGFSQQRLHLLTRGGSSDALVGKRGMMSNQPLNRLRAHALCLSPIGMRQRFF